MLKLLKAGMTLLWCAIAAAASLVLLLNNLEPRFYQRLVYPIIRSLRRRRRVFVAAGVFSKGPSSKKNRVGYWYDQKHRQMIRLSGIFSQLAAGPTRGF